MIKLVKILIFCCLIISTISQAEEIKKISSDELGQTRLNLIKKIQKNPTEDDLKKLFTINFAIDSDLVYNDYLNLSKELFKFSKEKSDKTQKILDEHQEVFGHDEYEKMIKDLSHYDDERSYADFMACLVNTASFYYFDSGMYKKNSWVPGVDDDTYSPRNIGKPDPFWTTLKYFSFAEIYYIDRKFLEADFYSQRGLQTFLTLDPEALFKRDILLEKMLSYFAQVAADLKMSSFLADIITSNILNGNIEFSNEYLELKILYWLYYISPSNLKRLSLEPETILNKAIQLDYKNQTKLSTLLNTGVALESIDRFEKNNKDAQNYFNQRKFTYPVPEYDFYNIANQFAEGIINKSTNIPSKGVKDYKNFTEQYFPKDNYAYLYGQVYFLSLEILRKRNANENFTKDLQDTIFYLTQITDLTKHPPGATIPGLLHENSLLLELLVNISLESSINKNDLNSIIDAASSLSLNSYEQAYIQNQDLIQNISDDYVREFTIELINFITKRNALYEGFYSDYFKGTKLAKELQDDLEIINEMIESAQLYLFTNNLIRIDQDKNKLNLNSNELMINTFCLANSCYVYIKKQNDIHVTRINKEDFFNATDKFINKINLKEDISEISNEFGKKFFNNQLSFDGINTCLIISTSNTINFPFHLLKINDQYLFDKCNLLNFSSLQHVKRRAMEKNFQFKNWALAVADPLIESSDSKKIAATLALIRGGSIDDLPELPETYYEAKAIIKNFEASSKLLSRETATKDNLQKESLSDYQLLSFSSHGLASGEIKDTLYPSILLSGDNKLLTTNDILDLNGISKLVLLAICNASKTKNQIILNPNEISSIASAFLTKGSNTVLSTRWNLNSKASLYIISNALLKYKNGNNLSIALKQSINDYRKLNPDAHEKDWAAFILFDDLNINQFKKVENYKGDGSVTDILEISNQIYISTIDKNDEIFINTLNEETSDLKKIFSIGLSYDAKFLSNSDGDILKLSENKIELIKNNNGNARIKCTANFPNKQEYYLFASTLKKQNLVFYSIKSTEHSNIQFGYINEDDCHHSYKVINLQNENWIHNNTAFKVINDDVYLMGNIEIPEKQRLYYLDNDTYTGYPKLCQFYVGLHWLKIETKNNTFELFEDPQKDLRNGYELPIYSNVSQTILTSKDYCSEQREIIKFDSFNDLDRDELFKKDKHPFNQYVSKTNQNFNLSMESFFNALKSNGYLFNDRKGFMDNSLVWKKITSKKTLDYIHLIGITDNKKEYITNTNQCNDFAGLKYRNKTIITCNQKEFYKILIH